MKDFTIPAHSSAPPLRSLAEVLLDFQKNLRGETITIGEIFEVFHERGFGILLLILAIPLVLIPIPGTNVPFALALVVITAQQALGRHTPWFPKYLHGKKVSCKNLTLGLKRAAFWCEKIEIFLKPRLGWVTQDGPSRMIGVAGLALSLFSAIPLPLTNSVPGIGIGLMALGIGMRDGLAILAGAFIGITWVLMLLTAVLVFGPEVFHVIQNVFHSILPG